MIEDRSGAFYGSRHILLSGRSNGDFVVERLIGLCAFVGGKVKEYVS